MRRIDKIIIHCAATPEGKDFTVADINKWHKKRHFKSIGYHYVIYRDGSVHAGRPESEVGAHTAGLNDNSIGVCYIGGVMENGKTPKDTRTDAQKIALKNLVQKLKNKYPKATIHGHNEFAAKACPSFNVQKTDLVRIKAQKDTSKGSSITFVDQAAEMVDNIESKLDEHVHNIKIQVNTLKALQDTLPSKEGAPVNNPNIYNEEDYSCEDELPNYSLNSNQTVSKIQMSMTHSIIWVNTQIQRVRDKIRKYVEIVTNWVQKQLKTIEDWIQKQIKKAEDYLAKKLSEHNSILGSIKNGISKLEGYASKVNDMINKANQILTDTMNIITNSEGLASNYVTIMNTVDVNAANSYLDSVTSGVSVS